MRWTEKMKRQKHKCRQARKKSHLGAERSIQGAKETKMSMLSMFQVTRRENGGGERGEGREHVRGACNEVSKRHGVGAGIVQQAGGVREACNVAPRDVEV